MNAASKTCDTCAHMKTPLHKDPCLSCSTKPGSYIKWKPLDPKNVLTGMKFDGGKRDFTLLPWAGVEEIVKVLEFGAQKYDRDNWKHVDDAQHRYTKAAFRHLIAYDKGEINDPESGLPHLAHLGCCIRFGL